MQSGYNKSKNFQSIPLVLLFDYDGVIRKEEESDDEEESSIESNEFIEKILVDSDLLKQVAARAKKHNIPCIILTKRTPNKINQDQITAAIEAIDGFNTKGKEGFHLDDIFCLGTAMQRKKGKNRNTEVLLSAQKSKLKVTADLHQQRYSSLPKKAMVFIDNEEKNTQPVEKEGFSVILAIDGCNKHLQEIIATIDSVIHAQYAPKTGDNNYKTKAPLFSGSTAEEKDLSPPQRRKNKEKIIKAPQQQGGLSKNKAESTQPFRS